MKVHIFQPVHMQEDKQKFQPAAQFASLFGGKGAAVDQGAQFRYAGFEFPVLLLQKQRMAQKQQHTWVA